MESTNGNFVQRHAEAVALLYPVEVLHSFGISDQKEKYLLDEKEINGIKTMVVYFRKSKFPFINFFRRIQGYKIGFRNITKPDLVHANILQSQMIFAVLLKWKYKIPFVVSEHWSGFLKINRHRISNLKIRIARFIANRASYVMPVSQMLLKELQSLKIGKKYKVVENVVDTTLFTPLDFKNNTEFIFLHISNLVGLKNPEKIISTAKRLRKEFTNFRLQIGGDGSEKVLKHLHHLCENEDYIEIFGEQTIEEVAKKMRGSHCFVLFSEYENLPCVLIESMSSGVPVIATRVGGIPEIVEDGCGILISKSEEELYQAMKKFLSQEVRFLSPEKLHQYAEERFSKIKIAKKLDAIYQEVMGLPKG